MLETEGDNPVIPAAKGKPERRKSRVRIVNPRLSNTPRTIVLQLPGAIESELFMITGKTFRLYSGHHDAKFLGVEEQNYRYGSCLVWEFGITHGYHQTIVNRITGVDPVKGFCHTMLSSLLGRPARAEDLEGIDSLIGEPYSVLIQYHDEYPRVESVRSPYDPTW